MNERTDGPIHAYVQTDTCMFMHRQTDRHTCTCIDGQTKSMCRQANILIETMPGSRKFFSEGVQFCEKAFVRTFFFVFF